MMTNIAIIGAGQLGSRHAQACAALPENLGVSLYVVDPSEASRTLTVERYNGVARAGSPAITALPSIDALPEMLDLVIIATTADVRLQIVRDLIGARTVHNWLLEKVLFQDLDEYAEAEALLGKAAERTWVNCSQRLWPFFAELKRDFGNDPALEITVTGSNWGLGCNAVHNTDIAAFLWQGALQHTANLDPEIIASKRSGFVEFTGRLETTVEGGGVVRQISYREGSAPFTFIATHPGFMKVWDVAAGTLQERSAASGWAWSQRELTAPFQSTLTTQTVTDILAGVPCGLPTFRESARVHMGTLAALIGGAEREGAELGRICPVT